MRHEPTDPSPLDAIPPPDAIRDRLARMFHEVRVLRQLLRVAEAKHRLAGAAAAARGREGVPCHN